LRKARRVTTDARGKPRRRRRPTARARLCSCCPAASSLEPGARAQRLERRSAAAFAGARGSTREGCACARVQPTMSRVDLLSSSFSLSRARERCCAMALRGLVETAAWPLACLSSVFVCLLSSLAAPFVALLPPSTSPLPLILHQTPLDGDPHHAPHPTPSPFPPPPLSHPTHQIHNERPPHLLGVLRSLRWRTDRTPQPQGRACPSLGPYVAPLDPARPGPLWRQQE